LEKAGFKSIDEFAQCSKDRLAQLLGGELFEDNRERLEEAIRASQNMKSIIE